MILREFGLEGEGCHIINGHVPVRCHRRGRARSKAGGKIIVIDGGFCRAYHSRTGIAGYTLVYNSRGLTLRTHQPFESAEKAIREDEDITSRSEQIYVAPQRILVRDTDEGAEKRALIQRPGASVGCLPGRPSAGTDVNGGRDTSCFSTVKKRL